MEEGMGASVGGNVDAGRDVVGRDIRTSGNDSHDIIVKLDEARSDLSSLHREILRMAIDIKLLQSMVQERTTQIEQLNVRMSFLDKAIFMMALTFMIFLFTVWR